MTPRQPRVRARNTLSLCVSALSPRSLVRVTDRSGVLFSMVREAAGRLVAPPTRVTHGPPLRGTRKRRPHAVPPIAALQPTNEGTDVRARLQCLPLRKRESSCASSLVPMASAVPAANAAATEGKNLLDQAASDWLSVHDLAPPTNPAETRARALHGEEADITMGAETSAWRACDLLLAAQPLADKDIFDETLLDRASIANTVRRIHAAASSS